MNPYICRDLVDLRKPSKHIWCCYMSDFLGEYKASTIRNESLWASNRKRLIEMLKNVFVEEFLNEKAKKEFEFDDEEFDNLVKEFKEMIGSFESVDGNCKYKFETLQDCYHIVKIYVDDFE